MDINSQITEKIKFEIRGLADQCLEIYKNQIDNAVKNSFDEFYDKVQSEIKNQIAENVCSKDLFDYSQIETPPLRLSFNSDGTALTIRELEEDLKDCIGGPGGFNGFVTGETVIINECIDNSTIVIITNYSRFISISFRGDNCSHFNYEEHNFWLPVDYIKIMKIMITSNNVPNQSIKYDEVLVFIKNHLYDRKFVPLYTEELVAENSSLKSKYLQYLLDREELDLKIQKFELERENFYQQIKPYTDIQKEKEILSNERINLRACARKIMVEKEAVKKMREELEKIDLEEI